MLPEHIIPLLFAPPPEENPPASHPMNLRDRRSQLKACLVLQGLHALARGDQARVEWITQLVRGGLADA